MMATESRVHKLASLLDSKNKVIRNEAIKALAIFPIRPYPLLDAIEVQLKSLNWTTRNAAAQAFEAILENYAESPEFQGITHETMNIKKENMTAMMAECLLPFSFDIISSIYHPLFAASSIEGENSQSSGEILKSIEKHLKCEDEMGLNVSTFIDDRDLSSSSKLKPSQSPKDVKLCISSEPIDANNYLEPESEDALNQWNSLITFTVNLLNSLCDPIWHIRHGAALALHKFTRVCFKKFSDAFIVTMVNRIYSILVLDVFSDFATGSNATAPIREAIAQCYVILVMKISEKYSTNFNLIHRIQDLFNSPESQWMYKQTAMIVLKYYFVIGKQDETYIQLYHSSINIMENSVDEVMSATLSALSAVFFNVNFQDSNKKLIQLVIDKIWNILFNKSRFEQIKQGVDSILLDIIKLIEFWSKEEEHAIVDQQKVAILIDMIDPGFVERTTLCLNSIYTLFSKGNLNIDDSEYLLVQKLFRCVLFVSYDSGDQLIEAAFRVLIVTLNHIESTKILENPNFMLVKSVGLWISALSLDVKDCAVNVDDFNLEGHFLASKKSRQTICGSEIESLCKVKKNEVLINRKIIAARFLAPIIEAIYKTNYFIGDQSIKTAIQFLLVPLLNSRLLYQKLSGAIIINAWAKYHRRSRILNQLSAVDHPFPSIAIQTIENHFMTAALDYDDCKSLIDGLQKEAHEYIKYLTGLGVPKESLKEPETNTQSWAEWIDHTFQVSVPFLSEKNSSTVKARYEYIKMKFIQLQQAVNINQNRLDGYCSSALFYFGINPVKLTPLIKPLFASLTTESNIKLCEDYLRDSFYLLIGTSINRVPCPHDKVLQNLLKAIKTREDTIIYKEPPKGFDIQDSYQIVSLSVQNDSETIRSNNSKKIIQWIIQDLGNDLQQMFPKLYELINCELAFTSLMDLETEELIIINKLELLKSLTPAYPWIMTNSISNAMMKHIESKNPLMRFQIASSLAFLSKYRISEITNVFYSKIKNCLQPESSTESKSGAMEYLYLLSKLENEALGLGTLYAPYALQLMSHSVKDIRSAAAVCFRNFVPMITLEESSKQYLSWLNEECIRDVNENKNFMKMLSNPAELPIVTQSDITELRKDFKLRPYQLEGITWMKFLAKYGLNGILADQMGLGKTIQTLSLLNIINEKLQYKCLIVCPATLVDHWCSEWKKYFPNQKSCFKTAFMLNILETAPNGIYVGAYEEIKHGKFKNVNWKYLILDEGHVIRRSQTQLFENITHLRSQHRLILSGTPVQNSPGDLWALFAFLMPDYFPDRGEFNTMFVKPIKACRSNKATEKILKEGENALQKLHKIALPFILRRNKKDVLKDLPEKSVSDYYCHLTPLQRKAYEAIVDNCAFQSKLSKTKGQAKTFSPMHTCILLRQLVDHPQFVQNEIKEVGISESIHGTIEESGKMLALKQLFDDCEIGASIEESNEPFSVQAEGSSNDGCWDSIETVKKEFSHRVLIFCQWKKSIDYLEQVFTRHQLGREVNYLVLDGSIPVHDRHNVGERFNGDPSIDVLLLSTHIGGVGLNLTGADVVIFFDHDWNPVKDLQAIDRAHRLGQKRHVMVYRLITKDTIEEKVMNLQKFKTNTANVIVGADNASLQTMDTSELVDLFSLSGGSKRDKKEINNCGQEPSAKKRKTIDLTDNSVINIEEKWDLDVLWSEDDYTEAHDLTSFANSST